MKNYLKIILFLLFSSNALGSCTPYGLYFWPQGRTINQNSIFIIDGYANSRKIINGLGKEYKIYLKSKESIINLLVDDIYESEYYLSQAILIPEEKLLSGQDYELIIENLEEKYLLQRYNYKSRESEKIIWTVDPELDIVAPVWNMLPKVNDKTYFMMGCGPTSYVNFKYSVTDDSDFKFKTTVKNITTGIEAIYYVSPTDSIIAIGHDMCSGAFSFSNGEDYEIEFAIIDASGNETKWTGDRIKFTRPL